MIQNSHFNFMPLFISRAQWKYLPPQHLSVWMAVLLLASSLIWLKHLLGQIQAD